MADKRLIKRHDTSKPQGVRGRNSDNARLAQVLGWQPSISLEQGLQITYKWIEAELRKAGRVAVASEKSAGIIPSELSALRLDAYLSILS